MKRLFLTSIILIVFIASGNKAQTQTEAQERMTNTNILKTYSTNDTKSLQKYYQNLFSSKKEEKEKGLMPTFDIQKEKLLEKLREAVPLEGAVNPDTYLVGPGDFFDISVWSDIPVSLTLIVSPEGSLIVPTVGVITIKDKTLSEVKSLVEKEVKKIYENSDVTLTLVSPRIFTVSVGGVVSNPGSFYASAVQRTDQAIYLANLQTNVTIGDLSKVNSDEKQLLNRSDLVKYFRNDELIQKNLEMSLRNIKVIRKNGDTLFVDLVRYYATGDVKYNPFLNDGDMIFVPNLDLEANFITVSGEVRMEGTYEYSHYDSLSSVLSITQGPTAMADLEKVNVYRTNFNTGEIEKITVNFAEIIAKKAPDLKLQPTDKVVFRKKYPVAAPLDVTVRGEVVSPGLYPIMKDKTTIKEIIEEAGGFTKSASLTEAKIIRFPQKLDKALENPDYLRLEELRTAPSNARTREYYNFEAAIRREFVAVNFVELFEKGNELYNITLEHGDIILIPPKQNTIYVYGQIKNPGYYQYMVGRDSDFYLELAGGLTEIADNQEIYIIKAGNNAWIDPDDTALEPGDAIFVSRDMDPRDKSVEFYYSWFQNAVTLVAGVATVVLTVILASKN